MLLFEVVSSELSDGLTQALLAIIASLVGAMIWVVKSLITRSDNLQQVRDEQINELVNSLNKAIGLNHQAIMAFSNFEDEEQKVHEKIIGHLDRHETALERITRAQERTASCLDRLAARLGDSTT